MAAAHRAGSYAAANSVLESNCPGLTCSSGRAKVPPEATALTRAALTAYATSDAYVTRRSRLNVID